MFGFAKKVVVAFEEPPPYYAAIAIRAREMLQEFVSPIKESVSAHTETHVARLQELVAPVMDDYFPSAVAHAMAFLSVERNVYMLGSLFVLCVLALCLTKQSPADEKEEPAVEHVVSRALSSNSGTSRPDGESVSSADGDDSDTGSEDKVPTVAAPSDTPSFDINDLANSDSEDRSVVTLEEEVPKEAPSAQDAAELEDALGEGITGDAPATATQDAAVLEDTPATPDDAVLEDTSTAPDAAALKTPSFDELVALLNTPPAVALEVPDLAPPASVPKEAAAASSPKPEKAAAASSPERPGVTRRGLSTRINSSTNSISRSIKRRMSASSIKK